MIDLRLSFLRWIIPDVRDENELGRFVWHVTLLVVACALLVDIVNQLWFFVSWREALRSWLLTTLLASGLAIVITRLIGKAHLDLYRTKVELEKLSRLDPLTGLQNRRALMESVESLVDTMVLVIIDIDRFKRVNDTHGHLAGDDVIRSISRILESDLGGLGHLARLGGEEFALLSTSHDPREVLGHLTAFRERMASVPMIICDTLVTVTISAGMALRGPSQSFMELYAEADKALYAAKTAGRNCIRLSPALRELGLSEERVDKQIAG